MSVVLRLFIIYLCVSFSASTWAANLSDGRLQAFLAPGGCPMNITSSQQTTPSLLVTMLLEPLAAQLISGIVDSSSNYLTSAATTKSESMSASVDANFYKLTKENKLKLAHENACIILVSSSTSTNPPNWYKDIARKNYSELPDLSKKGLTLYFEAQIIAGDGNPAKTAKKFRIKPVFLHIGEVLKESIWTKDTRNYSIAITFRDRISGTPFGAATFSFEELTPSTWSSENNPNLPEIRKSGTVTTPVPGNHISLEIDPYPQTGTVLDAVSEQELAIAKYKQAANIMNKRWQGPLQPPLPEWTVVSSNSSAENSNATEKISTYEDKIEKFQNKLKAYCTTLEASIQKKTNTDQPSPKTADTIKTSGTISSSTTQPDSRCPYSLLVASNDLERARNELIEAQENEWARNIVTPPDKSKGCDNNPEPTIGWSCNVLFPTPMHEDIGPFRIEATVVEVRDPTEFTKALASTFKANQDKYKTAIEEKLLPSHREAALVASQAAQSDLNLAKLQVEQAEAALAEAASQPRSNQMKLQAEVLKAKVAANTAARAAGYNSAPYPEVFSKD